jgi:hypothetical protein
VLSSIPAPGGGRDSGLAWAEGTLWVGQYRERKIHQVDLQTGRVLRTMQSNRFVTGVTWVDGELWHGTSEGDESDLRRIDPRSGEVLERIEMPRGVTVSGLESDGGDRFFCGGNERQGEGGPPAWPRLSLTTDIIGVLRRLRLVEPPQHAGRVDQMSDRGAPPCHMRRPRLDERFARSAETMLSHHGRKSET